MHHFAYRDGILHAEGVDLRRIAEEVGTPFYCYSSATLERHYRVFAEAFSDRDALVCYAMKANSNQAVLRTLGELGAGMDIVSEGELRRALAAGVPGERIVFSGVSKTRREMAFALDSAILCFNVESESELQTLSEVAVAKGVPASGSYSRASARPGAKWRLRSTAPSCASMWSRNRSSRHCPKWRSPRECRRADRILGRQQDPARNGVCARQRHPVLQCGVGIGAPDTVRSGGRQGSAGERIVFSGVSKTRREMAFALDSAILCFNVESESELQTLSEVAVAKGVPASGSYSRASARPGAKWRLRSTAPSCASMWSRNRSSRHCPKWRSPRECRRASRSASIRMWTRGLTRKSRPVNPKTNSAFPSPARGMSTR